MLSKLLDEWGDSMKKQSSLLNEELKGYFKYIKNEFIAFKEVKLSFLFYFLVNL